MLDFLKTAPAPEAAPAAAPEAVPQASTPAPSTMSIKAKILEYKKQNPQATAKEIASRLETSKVYVHQTLIGYKNPLNNRVKAQSKKSEVLAPKHKTEGFAIGVSQPHYWVISALASGKKTTRTAILQGIIDQYIRDVLTEVKSDGSSV